ncbi:GTPase-activating protein [Podila verticillata]|nr:GTPase-activating protein [Podila verticillata]
MVNKHASLSSNDGDDIDPLDTYTQSDAEDIGPHSPSAKDPSTSPHPNPPNPTNGATVPVVGTNPTDQLPTSGSNHPNSLGTPPPPGSDNTKPESSLAEVLAPAQATVLVSRTSWEENDSDDEPYPADAYDYGREESESEDEEEEEEKEKKEETEKQEERPPNSRPQDVVNGSVKGIAQLQRRTSSGSRGSRSSFEPERGQGATSYDQGNSSDEEERTANPSLFLAAANPRASVTSAKSYSSHTKHHSFGYDDRPEQEPSDSESESESESDPEEFVAARSAMASPSPVPAPIVSVPSGSRPVSVHSLSPPPASPTLERNKALSPPTNIEDKATSLELATDMSRPATPEELKEASKESSPSESVSQSLSSSSDQHYRISNSGSDTSVDLGSPALKPHMARPSDLRRTLSRSPSRGFGGQDANSIDRNRPISYATVNSEELNDISLDDSTPRHSKRSSTTIAAPRPPAPAGAGFPSSFFGARPHPMAQLHHHGHPPPAVPATLQPSPPLQPRSGANSISSIASSIQGAFRGLTGAQGLPPVPRVPSRNSERGSNAGMATTAGIDLRPTKSISPDRESIYSTMTTDSNMELLLARLDAQNTMLEHDPTMKRRVTTNSEMDRVIGHAKEGSTEEDVDWDYWGALMHDYNAVVKKNPKQLTHMIQRGVPSALRGLIWQLLSKSKDAALEASYAELLKTESSHEKQILRDMSRTFPNHDYFQEESTGQEHLFNVVKAYSLYDPEVGYCQGLSFVVGPLLLNMPDEEAFCVLVRMMGSYEMRGHYTPEMNMLQLRLYQYEQLMEEQVPIIHKHFQNQGIRSTMYASQWFMTLFAYKFPLELVFRVYDIIFVEGIDSLLRFAIALLKANHDKILNHDFETLIEYLKNGLFEYYMDDPSMFIRDAYDVKITPKKLAQYTQKYNAMVQKRAADLAAEESLRESNRQLSGHVRRLEGALHTLNKEHVDLAKELISRKVEMAQMQDKNDVLTQKVSDLTKIVDAQAKEVEDRYKDEIQTMKDEALEAQKKSKQLEEQMTYLENLVIETKMQYAESENEKDALARKLHDLKRALGTA